MSVSLFIQNRMLIQAEDGFFVASIFCVTVANMEQTRVIDIRFELEFENLLKIVSISPKRLSAYPSVKI